MVITFNDVTFNYTGKKILEKASFSLSDTDKVGIVGLNGTGKTTLLKLILGIEKPEKGEIIESGGMIINYLEQEPHFSPDRTILDIVMESSTKEHKIEEYEAKTVLSKMGFDDCDRKPLNFSGGENKRLAIAKVLVSYCDFLILDEPTNHLDTGFIEYLESQLIKFKHGLLMVTHDRYFLERVCTKMMELDFGKTYVYDANFSMFLELKEERLKLEEAAKRKLNSILRRETEWIHRGCEARSTKQKGRIQRYEEMSKITFDHHEDFEFSSVTTRLGKKLIEMKSGTKAYGDKTLFKDFSFTLQRNDCIGVVGENGAGKSTLFKIIMGLEHLDSGELIKGETLRIGYLPQHLELIDPEIRIIDYIREKQGLIETKDGIMDAASLLESFLFDRSIQYSKVKILSGGEKRRLQLVSVLSQNPNLLIFDEPTNDLDLYTLELLEDYILNFEGPVLTVSHDRYFLDKVSNKLFIFKNGRIEESILQYSEYLKTEDQKETKESSELENKKQWNKNRLPASIRNEYNKLNEEMPKIEERVNSLKEELSRQTTDYVKMMDLQKEIDELNASLDEKLERLLELEDIKNEYENGRNQ